MNVAQLAAGLADWPGDVTITPRMRVDYRVRTLSNTVRSCTKLGGKGRSLETFTTPSVEYVRNVLRGGRAIYKRHCIELNEDFLEAHTDEFVKQTVAHEVAHLVVYHMYELGMVAAKTVRRGHGPTWQHIMRHWFDVEPNRLHRYDPSNTNAKRQRRWLYRCGCMDHVVTTTRHNRVQREACGYRCRVCKTDITWTGDQA